MYDTHHNWKVYYHDLKWFLLVTMFTTIYLLTFSSTILHKVISNSNSTTRVTILIFVSTECKFCWHLAVSGPWSRYLSSPLWCWFCVCARSIYRDSSGDGWGRYVDVFSWRVSIYFHHLVATSGSVTEILNTYLNFRTGKIIMLQLKGLFELSERDFKNPFKRHIVTKWREE